MNEVQNTTKKLAQVIAPQSWMVVDFISDLHLKQEEKQTFAAFKHYISHTHADAIFILGDLFEAWIGDDCTQISGSLEEEAAQILRVTAAAIDIYFLSGNRDFLIGQEFLKKCGIKELSDPSVLSFDDKKYLLSHGDLLCTQDVQYQQFRKQVRNPAWQEQFLSRTLQERQQMAKQMRDHSMVHHAKESQQGLAYAQIDEALAIKWLEKANASTLIHGHTHQPEITNLGNKHKRICLSDWHIEGQIRKMDVIRIEKGEPPKSIRPSNA